MARVFYGNNQVSGTGIRYDMNATSITLGWKNMIQTEQEFGKSTASGFNIRMPEARYNGHEAPVVSLQGFIDTSLNPGTNLISGFVTDGSVGVQLSVGNLGSLALVGSGYLYYPMVNIFVSKHPQDTSNARQSVGGSVPVVMNDVSLIPDINSMQAGSEYWINYRASFTIVSGLI